MESQHEHTPYLDSIWEHEVSMLSKASRLSDNHINRLIELIHVTIPKHLPPFQSTDDIETPYYQRHLKAYQKALKTIDLQLKCDFILIKNDIYQIAHNNIEITPFNFSSNDYFFLIALYIRTFEEKQSELKLELTSWAEQWTGSVIEWCELIRSTCNAFKAYYSKSLQTTLFRALNQLIDEQPKIKSTKHSDLTFFSIPEFGAEHRKLYQKLDGKIIEFSSFIVNEGWLSGSDVKDFIESCAKGTIKLRLNWKGNCYELKHFINRLCVNFPKTGDNKFKKASNGFTVNGEHVSNQQISKSNCSSWKKEEILANLNKKLDKVFKPLEPLELQ